MALIWGALPRKIQEVQKVDGLPKVAEKRLLEERLVRKGDVIGIVAGAPMGISGAPNILKFYIIARRGSSQNTFFRVPFFRENWYARGGMNRKTKKNIPP